MFRSQPGASKLRRLLPLLTGISLLLAFGQTARGDDRLVGIWAVDEGYQTVEYLLRSDGRYQIDTQSTDPELGYAFTEGGTYRVQGETLTFWPYDYIGEPQGTEYGFQILGQTLALTRRDFSSTQLYELKAGSRAEVLAAELADRDLVGTWARTIQFYGREEYTFRPGGYYFVKNIPDDSEFAPEWIRGRYEQNDEHLLLMPYGGVAAELEIDFFGENLTFIRKSDFSGDYRTYLKLPGSETAVRAKAVEAEAFLGQEHWLVGVWEVRNEIQSVDLTFRPNGHYRAVEHTEFLAGFVRGRYTLEPGWWHLMPFVGQGLYARSNGEFGKVERTRALDYYDGELQIIDLDAISQSVTIARKIPDSEATVLEKARQAQLERQRDDWQVGIWEVNDPAGWMEFTFRPDHRYIAQSGTDGLAQAVERGRYLVGTDKVTLAPYSGLGAPRGFELDLYDGDLFLIGDLNRMVVARKLDGSETVVIENTQEPTALMGELGSILGRWTANLPGQSTDLVFREDGEFRLSRCVDDVLSQDYGLYTLDLESRRLVWDSRFIEIQTRELDFYGDTMTIHGGGLLPPSTYVVNLGTAKADIEDSFAADAVEAQIDAQWLPRVPVAPRNPNATKVPTADIPADPNPGRTFNAPTVLTDYRLYRRLIPGAVYFNDQGTIKSVAVLNTREWHFFPTGRVLVRFTNHRAGAFHPHTVVDVSDAWGAYRIEPKPAEQDILHRYADNELFIETDLGEQVEMTLEDGRRHLFWNKDYQILSEWAAEQTSVPCEPPANSDARLMNTGVTLTTQIEPDAFPSLGTVVVNLAISATGDPTLTGTTEGAGSLVTERTTSLAVPILWQTLQTNSVPGGPFSFPIAQESAAVSFFRVRGLDQ